MSRKIGKSMIAVCLILTGMLGTYLAYPLLMYFIGSFENNTILTSVTAVIALANIVLVLVTRSSLRYAQQADDRAQQAFVGRNRPLVDVTPISIMQNAQGTQAMTFFSVVNYSGFNAYKIGIDLKYGNNAWILEWRKARNEREEKGNAIGVVREKQYISSPVFQIQELATGETKVLDGREGSIGIIGSLVLERDVCARGNQGYPVWLRVTWQNVNGHTFDEVHKYKLICTKDAELSDASGGRAFTFIPEGIVSRKGGSGSVEADDEDLL